MKKRLFVVLALLTVGLPLFAAGSGQSSSSSSAAAANSLTVALLEGWYPAVSINNNLQVWQEIEKKTGTHINFQAFADYDIAMQPVIASGSQLPDIMLIPPAWGSSGVYQLGQDGVFLQLDDLIAKHAPNIQKFLKDTPELVGYITAPDGKIYSICDVDLFNNDYAMSTFFLRKDWMDKLGLKEPVTIDDWHSVLTAFRDRDPNGNGKKDEIPVSWIGAGSLDPLMLWGQAFGLPMGVTDWWYDNSGKVYYVYTSPQYRDFLTTMSQWYKEGLLDPELGRREEGFPSLVSTNVVGTMYQLTTQLRTYNDTLTNAGIIGGEFMLPAPVKSKDGGSPQIIRRGLTGNHYGISKDCKNPEIAIKWLDYVWGTQEGSDYLTFGIEGLTYNVVNGQKVFSDFVMKNPNGLSAYNALRSLGVMNNNFTRTPGTFQAAMNGGTPQFDYVVKYIPNRVNPFPALMLDNADQAIIDRISPDVSTYSAEIRAKMVIGEIPLTQWDDYVRTINSMGIADIQKIKQKVYDRSK